MRFEEHERLATEIAWLARQPLPVSLMRWNEFLSAVDEALRAEYVAGVEAAPSLAARAALDDETESSGGTDDR